MGLEDRERNRQFLFVFGTTLVTTTRMTGEQDPNDNRCRLGLGRYYICDDDENERQKQDDE